MRAVDRPSQRLTARLNRKTDQGEDMPDPGTELSSINFESLIGGPLVAAVHAQVQSALATVNFVKQVGFRPPDGGAVDAGNQTTGEPATVTFGYKKEVPKPDGT